MAELMPDSSHSMADAVIVSAYGRGNWLASELATRGWRVTLVDVTETLGPWAPEDAEGPFGLFEASDLLPSQKTRLDEEGEMLAVPQGFTVWLKDGPLECRSELTSVHLIRREIPRAVETYLRHPGLPDRESERACGQIQKLQFRSSWLAALAHQLPSHVIHENHRALGYGSALPIFAPFSIRQASGSAQLRGLKSCQATGVKIRQKAQVKDLRLEDKNVDAIEVHDEQSGVERGRTFVWMLSSAETKYSAGELAKVLFPEGAIEPSWYWTRYRVDFTGQSDDDQMPAHALLLEDEFLPWTHANAIVLRKRGDAKSGAKSDAKSYDAWIRLPTRARGDREYLERSGQEIEAVLKARMPLFEPKIVGRPAEAALGVDEMGPSPLPVFDEEVLSELVTLRTPNFFHCGPEKWPFLDWTGRYRAQNVILARLEKLRAQWLAQEAKARGGTGASSDEARP